MPAHRQSALLLHGLGAADRQWVLSRLGQADREVLEQHLAELKELGIPADPALLPRRRMPRPDGAAARVHDARPAAMQGLLDGEPEWMARQLLALGDWPWRDGYLAMLPAQQRERLLAPASPAPPPLAPAAAQALLARTAQRLAEPLSDQSRQPPFQARSQTSPQRHAHAKPPAGSGLGAALRRLRLALAGGR